MNKPLNIHVVYQHPDFYVVDKPSGIGFHDEGVDTSGSKESSDKSKQSASQNTESLSENELHVGESKKLVEQTGFFNLCAAHFSETLFPVHRLDKLTSGLLILARNKTAATWFQQAFENKQIQKYYLALSDSKPKKKQGSISGDMAKARLSQWKLLKTKVNPATTRFFNWGLASGSDNIKGLRLFLIKPETGKTHQIRVALKSLGSPVLGDKLYGGNSSDRGYLHALMLNFQYGDDEVKLISFPNSGSLFVDNEQGIKELVGEPDLHSWPKSNKSKNSTSNEQTNIQEQDSK
ncbi:RNA pseudouridine synthase [Psychrosphaera saromensis]|uniref:Pseudouridine synthase RsuA/RluA-like domain-containing protein n=1 Tax=Psychrosphaera saromensis TaxID=716813 RepID=A0A2S7UXA4_9GAMM|nr:pseudouridine synthase [Psychrosphaera saromensis]PQJ54634.1 hypothetical protein BTO11_13920 [Psychrosphaera saromensis]GHB58441.1 RNA pseudouridine synthase [Psychrosphaera saromensis]GLQ14146.1 RNA pseudouridine synthase [Psychrosphaera saromensis]